jgi:protein tyrosine phosphatase (PTP) superfamily phosphohydrolase (DUF442 family)
MMKMISSITLSLGLLVLSSCAHKTDKDEHCQKCEDSQADKYLSFVGPEVKIGDLSAKTFKHMSFAAQPSQKDIAAAKAMGYEVIINLRPASDVKWDVADEVKKNGMTYYNVPLLDKSEEIDVTSVMKLEKIHKDTHSQKQLIYCSTGNRAAAWMAAHLMVKHDLSAAESIKVARKLGLTKPELEEKIQRLESKLKSL